MKKLSIEEKSQRYDEIIEKLRTFYRDYDIVSCLIDVKKELANLIPELKESEDERIRKELLEHCKNQAKPYILTGNKCPQIQSWIDWLENQSEQNLADKIEPKFKVGDWISHITANFVFKVTSIGSYGYSVVNRDNYSKSISFDNEEKYHLWTIQDAKDGDVLADDVGVILLRKIGNEKYADVVDYYCVVGTSGKFEIQEKDSYWGRTNDMPQLHPATKEQRDLLFQKMKEAGYTFDFEKKELKKIAQEPVIYKKQLMNEMAECIETYIQQNPTEWSEEDEDYINDLIKYFSQNERLKNTKEDIVIWLKSLKNRLQPKTKLSEEDERTYKSVLYAFEHRFPLNCEQQKFVKSLRPQKQWKPSDEQMDALRYVTNFDYGGHKATLVSLYEQLKKLRNV